MPASTILRPNQAPITVPYVAGNSQPRQNQHAYAPAPARQPQHPNERPAPHRRPGIARKIANFVMNGGRRHTGRHAAAIGRQATMPATPAAERTPATPVAKAPVHTAPKPRIHAEQQVPAPVTSKLRYPQGEARGTRPHEVVEIGTHQPLLTREQVNRQLGFEAFGDLQMVVHLPGAKEPLYGFKSTQDLGKGDVQIDYRFATPSQLTHIRTSVHNGAAWDKVYEEMLHLNRINNGETVTSTDGVRAIIGSDHWLPGRAGTEHRAEPGLYIPEGMEGVAPSLLDLHIDGTNNLAAINLATPYVGDYESDTQNASAPAVIELNPALIPAGDEWPHAPINQLQGTTHFPTTPMPV